MDGKKVAIRNAKIGYVAIVGMLIVDLMLASFVFFDIGVMRVRELFLAVGTLMAVMYAVSFPTKLMPSTIHLLKGIIYLLAPLILAELIASPNTGGVAITGYVINVVITSFCTYMCMSMHSKVVKYLSEENYNDYSIFEAKTFKAHEINIYMLAFIFVTFFTLMASDGCPYCIAVGAVNLVVAIALDYVRTKAVLSDKIKLYHYVFESIATALSFAIVVLVELLSLSSLLFIAALVLLVPTIVMTIAVYRALNSYMYK